MTIALESAAKVAQWRIRSSLLEQNLILISSLLRAQQQEIVSD